VFRLPTELILLIFRRFGSDFRHRLALTHICRRWRQIAVNDASLWTNIFIQTRFRKDNSHLDNFLSFLSMELDRTADLPLDLTWTAQIGDGFFIDTLFLLRAKAPFHRWRTLTVQIIGGSRDEVPWSPIDVFTNLESLTVGYGTHITFISAIDRTIISHLKMLNLRDWRNASLGAVMKSFARSLNYISTFMWTSMPPTSPLPKNIVKVQLETGRHHFLPHIQTYEVDICKFGQGSGLDLANTTTLVVSTRLEIESDCQVLLPALRELRLAAISMDRGSRFEAPALNTLHYLDYGIHSGIEHRSSLERSFLEPGYLLSPNTSIIVDLESPSKLLSILLVKSPKAIQATLRFKYWADAQAVVEKLVRLGVQADSSPTENENLCPRLSELRLDFGWKLSASSTSMKWLVDRVKARRDAGITPPLSIYAGWKGEGTYVLLTGE
jgi:hypothetical protein